ncbi:MAG: carboxypeptidase-like regulatory domain-containing protein [Candidatus Binatia bacterium]
MRRIPYARRWALFGAGMALFLLLLFNPFLLVYGVHGLTYPPFYRAAAIDGRVVDDRTGDGLGGAIVVGGWKIDRPYAGPVWFHLSETVTDATGRYHLPAWGPKLRWRVWLLMPGSAPELIAYKRGYAPTTVFNRTSSYTRSPYRTSDWNGKAIRVQPLGQALADADVEKIASFAEWLTLDFFEHSCDWRHVRHLIAAVHADLTALHSEGLWVQTKGPWRTDPRSLWEQYARQRRCGSLDTVLRDIEP